MPIYKYECKACGHQFEDLRGFDDPNPEACPECDAAEIRRLISGGHFQLKGEGWYVTEYGDKSVDDGHDSETNGSDQDPSADDTDATSEGGGADDPGADNSGADDTGGGSSTDDTDAA